jgi:hypothetical protein
MTSDEPTRSDKSPTSEPTVALTACSSVGCEEAEAASASLATSNDVDRGRSQLDLATETTKKMRNFAPKIWHTQNLVRTLQKQCFLAQFDRPSLNLPLVFARKFAFLRY